MKPAARTAYVGPQAREYDQRRFVAYGGRMIAERETALLKQALASVAEGSRVLEVGCGTGRLLLNVHAMGMRCTGVDASPDMLAQAEGKFSETGGDAVFHLSEAARLPFEDGSFDFVYTIRMLNQTESPAYACRVIAELVRVAKPGGYVLVEFANIWRPRIGPKSREPVRLSPKQVHEAAAAAGASLVWMRGLFLLGMTASLRAPDLLQPGLAWLDGTLSRMLPRLCARGYAFFEKPRA